MKSGLVKNRRIGYWLRRRIETSIVRKAWQGGKQNLKRLIAFAVAKGLSTRIEFAPYQISREPCINIIPGIPGQGIKILGIQQIGFCTIKKWTEGLKSNPFVSFFALFYFSI